MEQTTNNLDTNHVKIDSKIGRKYLFKKSTSDEGDLYHNFTISKTHVNVDLTNLCPDPYDQGNLGSCTANGISLLYQFDEMKEKNNNVFTPSRLFIYYGEREIEGTINEDSGAQIKDGIKFIASVGVCPEYMLPYNTAKFTEKPSEQCYEVAKLHKCTLYKRVQQTLDQMGQCLAEGFPFVCGINIFENFESEEVAKTGVVSMPQSNEGYLGGHCVCCIGINWDKKHFIMRNSWGNKWGDKGNFYLPFEYLTSHELTSDLWTVRVTVDK